MQGCDGADMSKLHERLQAGLERAMEDFMARGGRLDLVRPGVNMSGPAFANAASDRGSHGSRNADSDDSLEELTFVELAEKFNREISLPEKDHARQMSTSAQLDRLGIDMIGDTFAKDAQVHQVKQVFLFDQNKPRGSLVGDHPDQLVMFLDEEKDLVVFEYDFYKPHEGAKEGLQQQEGDHGAFEEKEEEELEPFATGCMSIEIAKVEMTLRTSHGYGKNIFDPQNGAVLVIKVDTGATGLGNFRMADLEQSRDPPVFKDSQDWTGGLAPGATQIQVYGTTVDIFLFAYEITKTYPATRAALLQPKSASYAARDYDILGGFSDSESECEHDHDHEHGEVLEFLDPSKYSMSSANANQAQAAGPPTPPAVDDEFQQYEPLPVPQEELLAGMFSSKLGFVDQDDELDKEHFEELADLLGGMGLEQAERDSGEVDTHSLDGGASLGSLTLDDLPPKAEFFEQDAENLDQGNVDLHSSINDDNDDDDMLSSIIDDNNDSMQA